MRTGYTTKYLQMRGPGPVATLGRHLAFWQAEVEYDLNTIATGTPAMKRSCKKDLPYALEQAARFQAAAEQHGPDAIMCRALK